MKNLTFGIEIELTGISREKAANTVAQYFNTSANYIGGGYDKWQVLDTEGRSWAVVNDSSIRPQTRRQGRRVATGADFRVEAVSPICRYNDIETVQKLIRALREAGAFANRTCAIHLHIGKERFSARTLRNLVNIIASKEDLIYQALNVYKDREQRYCRKVNSYFLAELNWQKPQGLEQLANIWYGGYNGRRGAKYHSSRYHGLNLHSVFHGPTVEFRFFNGTTHAGKAKAYIQFCLSVCAGQNSNKGRARGGRLG